MTSPYGSIKWAEIAVEVLPKGKQRKGLSGIRMQGYPSDSFFNMA
ncbi:hypothetical protein ACFQ3W_14055 [Paenibacillus puldeungensis]|uniref:Uncharacterized protein n=1 Tax=Paenibacillus puldeungensis TaxID=696536 RepID=A0ABW3RZR8_9BACL